jgi:hypothetical protein
MPAHRAVQYFKVTKSRHQYLGDRYFRFDYQAEICTQICKTVGDIKKGKSNTYGVYLISKLTFFGNYLGPGYIEVINKAEFTKHFDEVINALKP